MAASTNLDQVGTFKNLTINDGGNFTTSATSVNNFNGSNFFSGTINAGGNTAVGALVETPIAGTQALSTGNTITAPAGTGMVRVTCAAAVTGIQLPAGTTSGQMLTVINESAAANTITYGNTVAGGTAHAGLTARKFEWAGDTNLWYPCL